MAFNLDWEHVGQLCAKRMAKKAFEKVKTPLKTKNSSLKTLKLCNESQILPLKRRFQHFHLLEIVFLVNSGHQKRKFLFGELCFTIVMLEKLLKMLSVVQESNCIVLKFKIGYNCLVKAICVYLVNVFERQCNDLAPVLVENSLRQSRTKYNGTKQKCCFWRISVIIHGFERP